MPLFDWLTNPFYTPLSQQVGGVRKGVGGGAVGGVLGGGGLNVLRVEGGEGREICAAKATSRLFPSTHRVLER